jgi:hypothetical protein
MLVMGLNFIKSEVEFWVCCGSWEFQLFLQGMWAILSQDKRLYFEKIEHMRGIWWKVKPYLRKHNIKFYSRF